VPAATPEAVACTISGVTAAASLAATARVQAGDVVLVTAAAGGTGHFAVQVAAAAGAHVVATCGGGARVLRGAPHPCAASRAPGAQRARLSWCAAWARTA
jgi:hypothetical protein